MSEIDRAREVLRDWIPSDAVFWKDENDVAIILRAMLAFADTPRPIAGGVDRGMIRAAMMIHLYVENGDGEIVGIAAAADAILAAFANEPLPLSVDREAVARIVYSYDPATFYDREDGWCHMPWEQAVEEAPELVECALEKADAILALQSPDAHTLVNGGETWGSINQWCDDTFGVATPEQIVARAKEEWTELEDAIEVADISAAAIEAADVVICLCRIPGFADALQAKMAINRKRKWRLVGNGTGYHIPETPASEPDHIDGVFVDVASPFSGEALTSAKAGEEN